MKTSGNNTIPW